MANKALVGEKVGMTQVWDDADRVVPLTVIRVSTRRVVQIKTPERDLVLVRGSVPGPKGGLVLIRDAVKAGA
jgi:ribosomal protein L3